MDAQNNIKIAILQVVQEFSDLNLVPNCPFILFIPYSALKTKNLKLNVSHKNEFSMLHNMKKQLSAKKSNLFS